jgi:prepilin-type N-terminal cleavage/methylation domain-containing protein
MLTSKGFTLIEVLAAAFIVTMGAGATFALVSRVTSFTSNASLQLEASYLAQEGVEVVHNIRTANFLKIHKDVEGIDWKDGLVECNGGCEIDYDDTVYKATPFLPNEYGPSQGRFLKLNGGLYNYTTGEDTVFQRAITITNPFADLLEVAVQVTWQERSRTHEVRASTKLYNWLTPTQ